MNATNPLLPSMHIERYTISFLTPAFLGDAEQGARWRTPPFKHLLREWWRVLWWASHRDTARTVAAMRREEGRLFGHAWLEDDTTVDERGRTSKVAARQSAVRIRLDHADAEGAARDVWKGRTSQGVGPLKSNDPTVGYAWFGLANRGRGQTDRRRLEPGEARALLLAYPLAHEDDIRAAMGLAHFFGTLGSRSRGGWGSLHVEGQAPLDARGVQPYTDSLDGCLSRDWAAAIAADAHGPWLWRSRQTFATWDKAIGQGAKDRRAVRTALDIDLRRALGFASPGRMPSPLRWKVVRDSLGLKLQVVAMPHGIPAEAGAGLTDGRLKQAWNLVRGKLDDNFDRVK
jgi:CRISPR-associated protein Cmr1